MPSPIILVILIVILLIVGIPYYTNSIRNKGWQSFARNNGFTYTFNDEDFILKFKDHYMFLTGGTRNTYNICQGNQNGMKIYAFDFQYTLGDRRSRQTFVTTVVAITAPIVFKPIYIRPEYFMDKLTGSIGLDDINFESAEFSRKYFVKCEDKKFAYDILHARMMEFLLSCVPMTMEGQYLTMVFHRNKKLLISEVEVLLSQANEFMELIPDYMKTQHLQEKKIKVRRNRWH